MSKMEWPNSEAILFAPITSERIRTACRDPLVLRCVGGDDKYQAKGSW
jgi:hypothetical protein